MQMMTAKHFGMNVVLTNDSAKDGSAFRGMTNEIKFSNFRYPGGGVTEDQTWENGGLSRMFGNPMKEGDDDYCMTIREAFELAESTGASVSIVIPTFQFYNEATDTYDHKGFDKYLDELDRAISESPNVKISGLEIGNEYWAKISASDYGKIANIQIPKLASFTDSLSEKLGAEWTKPTLGIQAGAAWKQHGVLESKQIAQEISLESRGEVDVIYQHAYPNPYKDFDAQMEGALDPVEAFRTMAGFKDDFKTSLSEFNMGIHAGSGAFYGVNQGTLWIEELHRHVTAGVDQIDHWGGAYKWLTTKMYDAKFPPAEGYGGDVWAKATPVGQVLDIASSELIGLRTIDDDTAVRDMDLSDKLSVTGFSSDSKRVVFIGNVSDRDHVVNLKDIENGSHVSVRHISPADSPHTPWHDESSVELPSMDRIVDARADMNVVSGDAVPDSINLSENELIVVTITEPGRGVFLEGAHNVTDDTRETIRDHIVGGTGNDLIFGHVGDDTLIGNSGNNVIVGGSGSDIIIGGDSRDIIISDNGSDHISAGSGLSLIIVSGGNPEDVVFINAENGDALILADGTRSVVVTSFKNGDSLGFGQLFQSQDDFLAAAKSDEGDAIVSLPTGTSIVVIDGAWILENPEDSIFDFWSPEDRANAADQFLGSLYQEQLDVSYHLFHRLSEGHNSAQGAWRTFQEYSANTEVGYSEDTDNGTNEPPETGTIVPTVPPSPEDEGYPEEDQNDDGSGGSCFVATAAYGNRSHPDVVALRAFRDKHLCRYRAGRIFIKLYWIVGPQIATVVRPTNAAGSVSQYILSRLVRALRFSGLT